MDLVIFLGIGLLAGFLASRFMNKKSNSLVVDLALGVIGAFVGNWLFGVLGISLTPAILGSIVSATVGAVILIAVLRIVR